MTLDHKIKDILAQIEKEKNNPSPENTLPQNSFYLNENDIVCLPREYGESRYPYLSDELMIWAKQSGCISALDVNYRVFRETYAAEESPISFFGGIPNDDGTFTPVSLFEWSAGLDEAGINRYVVFCPKCAYYIADTENLAFAVRVHADSKKQIHFAHTVINKSDKEQKFYLFASFEPTMSHSDHMENWSRSTKLGKYVGDGTFRMINGRRQVVVKTATVGGKIEKEYYTTSKDDALGTIGKLIPNSLPLKTGCFKKNCIATQLNTLSALSEIVHYSLEAGQSMRREYRVTYSFSEEEALNDVNTPIDIKAVDQELSQLRKAEIASYDSLKIKFGDWSGDMNGELFNKFIRSMQKQVTTCALSKIYNGQYIGIRDIMQQLEGSLMWCPKQSREKFLTSLDFILDDGRPPRQYSLPHFEGEPSDMDNRKYIDQGVWIISTLYTYLTYTEDFAILDEMCDYRQTTDEDWCQLYKSDRRDTVLEHIFAIMDYMEDKLDTEVGTYGLRILHGDWNDAIDGLGKTNREGRAYGSGVTVMATLQFWQNLREMCEILEKIGGYEERIAHYKELSKKIEEGLFKYAVETNDQGERRIIHGWGDLISYKIGSWNDPDGKSRISSTCNSFWAMSGMIYQNPEFKNIIMDAFNGLDSKYGLLTFDKPFLPDTLEYAGRIGRLLPGLHENSAVYIHATAFAVTALFILGESERAWKELEKILVINIPNCSKTTFAMPNSYCVNDELCIDGDSMGDWYTGCTTAILKGMVKYGLGIQPTLDGIFVQTAKNIPANSFDMDITVKGCKIDLQYEKLGNERKIYIDGKEAEGEFDTLMATKRVFIPTADIHDGMVIKVTD